MAIIKTKFISNKILKMGRDPIEILYLIANGLWEELGYESETSTKYTSTGMPFEAHVITMDHRLTAASAAAGYFHPKLQSVRIDGPPGAFIDPTKHLTDKELDSQ